LYNLLKANHLVKSVYSSVKLVQLLQKKYLKKFAIKKTFEVYLHPPKKYMQLL